MKRFVALTFAGLLILSACDNDESNHNDNNQSSKTSESHKASKEDNKKESNDKQNKSKEEHKQNDSDLKDNESNQNETNDSEKTPSEDNEQTTSQNIDPTNITDRASLEAVIYGDYDEETKLQAYNSAVANGVIPQGNVMEGPASAAYESSLRVERGEEKSVYDRPDEQDVPVDDDDAELDESEDDTNEVEQSDNSDVVNNKDVQYDPDNKYMNAPDQEWRNNVGGGLSSGEIQTRNEILKGTYDGDNAQEVLDAINYYEKTYGN